MTMTNFNLCEDATFANGKRTDREYKTTKLGFRTSKTLRRGAKVQNIVFDAEQPMSNSIMDVYEDPIQLKKD